MDEESPVDEEARLQAQLARVRAGRAQRKYASPSPSPQSPSSRTTIAMASPTSPRRLPLDDGPGSPKSSWEPMIADRIMGLCERGSDGPLLVAIVGPPGCGKSTSAAIVAQMVPKDVGSIVVPMDGYHIPLEKLKSMPNSEELVYRRGCPDTFDPAALRADLRLVKTGDQPTVEFPGFDHAAGDPVAAQHTFTREEHSVVIVEGLYLLRREEPWTDTSELFDLTIFIESDIDECISRLKVRNQCIPGYTTDQINKRCEDVDRANAVSVSADQKVADIVVPGLATHKMAAFQGAWNYSWQARSLLASLDGPQTLDELVEELPPRHFATRPVW